MVLQVIESPPISITKSHSIQATVSVKTRYIPWQKVKRAPRTRTRSAAAVALEAVLRRYSWTPWAEDHGSLRINPGQNKHQTVLTAPPRGLANLTEHLTRSCYSRQVARCVSREMGAGARWQEIPRLIHARFPRQTRGSGHLQLTGNHTFGVLRVPVADKKKCAKRESPESWSNLLFLLLSLK